MTAADVLTIARALLALPVCLLILTPGAEAAAAALALFGVAAVTDGLDGIVARRLGPTARGALLDPLADKLLVLGALGTLAASGGAPLWMFALVASREAAITWLRRGGGGPTVELGGKIKAAMQDLAILGLLAGRIVPALTPIALVVLAAAVAMTVLSGARYLLRPARLAA